MKYNPKNYREMSFDPPDAGMCHVDIIDADMALIQRGKNAGNEQIVIKLEVCQGQKGAGYKLYDYVSSGEYFESKVGSIFKSCGLEVPGNEIEINADTFRGKGMSGTVMLRFEEWPIGSGQMKPKVWYWCKPEDTKQAEQKREDDIPF